MAGIDVWADDKVRCRQLFTDFVAVDKYGRQSKKYLEALQAIANRETKVLPVDLDDVYQEFDQAFADTIQKNTLRYITIFGEIADQIMPEPTIQFDPSTTAVDDLLADYFRKKQEDNEEEGHINPELFRRFEVIINPQSGSKTLSVRQLHAQHIGALVTVRAIVTRASEVKPRIIFATYTCTQCGGEVAQEVKANVFMPLSECPRAECQRNKKGAKLQLQTRGSRFVKYQDLRVQELSSQVPHGHTPRSLSVHCKSSSTRQGNPGDIIEITGIYLPRLETGYRAIRAGLLAVTYIEALTVTQTKGETRDTAVQAEVAAKVEALAANPDAYHMLAQSIGPEIYGHEDIKCALLLILVGGVTRKLEEGMIIRGDINVLLMGDPGVAKSQLLRCVVQLCPRGVFTTGKGSTGVGLTAAVQRDPMTDEMVLEGGALVLADKGVCAIDEFDKMEEGDRTAIYEVMEQQTVSIAKAGIATTLNARAAVLAAANPQYGRYNVKKTVQDNVNLPPALLSRFDLLFLVLDTPNSDSDQRLAEHVTYVHMHGKHPDLGFDPVSDAVIRAYIAQAKQHNPTVPASLSDYIVEQYVNGRKEGLERYGIKPTPRSLLALLRLATARARLRFADSVCQDDIDEAARLIESSRSSLEAEEREKESRSERPIDRVFEIVNQLLKQTKGHVASYDKARRTVISKGFTANQLAQMLDAYLAVFLVDDDQATIRYVSPPEDMALD